MTRSLFHNRTQKIIAVFIALNIFVEAIMPNQLFALTGGPASPEFSSFEPVATTNMINEFSGDFTYNLPVLNIPGPDGSGYSMSLSYHSGISPEEEASWVGYGWTLNPGAINRNKRGIPDDWNDMDIGYWNKTKANKTITVGTSGGAEVYSYSLGVNSSLRYNNYKGFGYVVGINFGVANGAASLGYTFSDGEGSFSWKINPAQILKKLKKKDKKKKNEQEEIKDLITLKQEKADAKIDASGFQGGLKANNIAGTLLGSSNGVFSFSEVDRPSTVTPYTGYIYNIDLSLVVDPVPLQIGGSVSIFGSYLTQSNTPVTTPGSYGFLYSKEGDTRMMDFHLEKSATYNKQDYFIGIPVSNADVYGVTGESLSGGFRAFHGKSGYFHPNNVTSTTYNISAGASVTVGLSNGGGGSLALGGQTCKVKSHTGHTGSFSGPNSTDTDEGVFFRFNNDMGGYVAYDDNDDLLDFDHSLPSSLLTEDELRSKRASYIGYSFNKEIAEVLEYEDAEIRHLAYCKDESVHAFVKRGQSVLSDQIGEFSIVNEDGYRYTYGLPVYSRMEKDMSYSLHDATVDDNLFIVESDASSSRQTVIGESRPDPYATTHLLTALTTPDYIDRLNDGPSVDDFGGYTRFSYERLHGTYDKDSQDADSLAAWYKWRMPYAGLYYQKNEMSNKTDDLGSVSEGLKEIYYLDKIETKTHYAVFIKSQPNERLDGIEASHEDDVDTDLSSMGENQLKRLEKIELYAKGSDGEGENDQLLKTIHFDYSYESFPDIPNTIGTGNNIGKLSLTKVWFEYEGIYNAKISPYVFEYNYPNTSSYPAKYASLETPSNQSPVYSKFDIDAWGNYQVNGGDRFANMRPWLDQGDLSYTGFDPAAWQLKNIKLPSGGEIHVQYEQDDYSYVQDKLAHALVRLDSTTPTSGDDFILDVDTDIDFGTEDLDEITAIKHKMVDQINEIYGSHQKRMYFKFLYQMLGASPPTLDDYLSEYLTGYVYVTSASLIGGKIVLTLGSPDSNSDYYLPKNLCTDYVITQRAGNISNDGGGGADGQIFQDNDAVDIAERFFNFVETLATPTDDICLNFNPELSYFKIPMITDKRGGGVRVKRLMMFDEGIASGEESLYGSEYHYKTFDEKLGRWKSSGVATNEPSSIREENVLVEVLPRGTQGLYGKMVCGRDKKQSEGPLGESFLPSPSVGYSRVVVNNIHSGPTSPGFSIKEFYTVKDYPLSVDYSALNTVSMTYLPLTLGVINLIINNIDLEQGFLFKDYNMHGQMKSSCTYAGDYYAGSAITANSDTQNGTLVGSTSIEYFDPEEGLPILRDIADLEGKNSWDQLEKLPLGKESEIIKESREVSDHSAAMSGEVDVTLGYIPPIVFIGPQFGWSLSGTHTQSDLKTHVASKLIKYPVVQKSVITKQDNMIHTTENIAYNPHTGKPILTTSNDGFDALKISGVQDGVQDGDILTLNIPAASKYDALGQISRNERLQLISGTTDNPELDIVQLAGEIFLNLSSLLEADLPKYCEGFSVGDLIEIKTTDSTEVCHITDIQGSNLKIVPTYYSANIDYLADETIVSARVIRSGRSNQLSANSGNIVFYGRSVPELTVNTTEDIVTGSSNLSDFIDALNTGDTIASADFIQLDTLISNIQEFYHVDASNPDIVIVSSLYVDADGNTVPLCSTTLFDSGDPIGRFAVDPSSGQVVYYSSNNESNYQTVPCITTFGFENNSMILENVLSSSSNSYSDDWGYTNSLYYPNYSNITFNNYESGKKGRWRADANYVYRDTVRSVITGDALNYEAGLYQLQVFDWENPVNNASDKWLKTSSINDYSPNGNMLEEQNILNIRSSAKFGYHKTLPYLIAKNAPSSTVVFESFENEYFDGSDTYFEDGMIKPTGMEIETNFAHSGDQSIILTRVDSLKIMDLSAADLEEADDISLLSNKQLLVKMWVKAYYPDHLHASLIQDGSTYLTDFIEISEVGEWALYQAILPSCSSGDIEIWVVNTSTHPVYVDDIKAHPSDAQVNTYVYDVNTHRVICTFDDQHFGLFYQYNSEGKLVRKQKETVRGFKTIQEAQYNTKLVPRSIPE